MSTVVHNPDQHMAALRTIIAQGRKRIGVLTAGAISLPCLMPLFPDFS
jgi:hypothetical protein